MGDFIVLSIIAIIIGLIIYRLIHNYRCGKTGCSSCSSQSCAKSSNYQDLQSWYKKTNGKSR